MLELHTMAGHLIRRLNQISTSVFQKHVKAAGYPMTSVQFAAMSALQANPGIDQITLAGMIAYDKVTIGGVVERLEKKGLINRERSEKDRRAKAIKLTRQGEDFLKAVTPVVVKLQDQILSGLDQEEKEQFLQLAAKATAVKQ
ncbi:MAG: MarR family transcriptional regulator [Sneathiellales bacterium]|nr:MarR family transcriptional regulator [Sneathiellales bacterium]